MLDTSCFRSKFKIICYCIVICSHFSNIYVWACTSIFCHLWINIVEDNYWLLVLKVASLRPTGKLFLARGQKKVGPPCSIWQGKEDIHAEFSRKRLFWRSLKIGWRWIWKLVLWDVALSGRVPDWTVSSPMSVGGLCFQLCYSFQIL
jgi:hypothetical protein